MGLDVNGDFAWKRLSSTLDAGAKVYGYRVDSLHSDTYRIRSGLNRSDPSNFKGIPSTFIQKKQIEYNNTFVANSLIPKKIKRKKELK